MYKYIIKRLLLAIPTLFGAAVLVFCLLRLVPGDVCEIRLAGTGLYADPAEVELCREKLGLNKPMVAQFWDFVSGYFTWDLGESMWTGKPISYEIGLRFKLSLQIAIMATLVAIAIAIPLGIISAVKQDTWIDYAVRTFSIAGIAIPSFWLGIMIILGLLIATQAWFGAPWMPPIDYVSPFEDPWRNMSQALLEVLREDYVRTARSKGLMERVIINRHALKNALLPVVTIIAIEFAFLIGGLVVTEQVFNLNGLGKLFVESVGAQDFNLTQQLVMLVVLIFVLTNLVVDILYAWLDPRIRYS
jgi:peptide/nickel transport system permease protein